MLMIVGDPIGEINKVSKSVIARIILASLLAVLLAGCGGGSATTPASATEAAPAVTAALTEAAVAPTENVVRFQNDGNGRFNSAEFDLRALQPPQANLVYFAWLVADDGTSLLLGEVKAGAVTPFPDAQGRNLLALYSGAWVSLETAGTTPAKPTLDVLGARLPASLLPTLRELFVTADTPDGLPFEPGAKLQSDVANEHAGLANEAATGGDLTGARKHAEHIINIIVGEASGDKFGIAFGDHDGNGVAENPGDGYGVWPYTNQAIDRLDVIIESADASDRMKGNASLARQCLVNLRTQMDAALDHAKDVLAAADAGAAVTATTVLQAATDAGTNGIDANGNGTIELTQGECGAAQAYQLSHEIAAILLEPLAK